MAARTARVPVFTIGCDDIAPVDPGVAGIGFKAYNLWRMARLALPVPPAFVLGTDLCAKHARGEPGVEALLVRAIDAGIERLEAATGLRLGDARRPLVVSVRSGAPVSMPGMLETVLDVGLSDATLRGVVRLTGNPRMAWDSYRRLVESFFTAVEGQQCRELDVELGTALREAGVCDARGLDFAELRALVARMLDRFESIAGRPFPQDPRAQLLAAVRAVFDSWRAPKAAAYRALNGLDDGMGTAATIQQMVYGNAGARSGSGVGFTRNPGTGERALYLDFLFNAQGEDVVSGRRSGDGDRTLAEALPEAQRAIEEAAALLEREFGDMQEFEFTVQDERLFLLQARTGKRTPLAAARIAVEMVGEGMLSRDAALERLRDVDLSRVARTRRISNGARVIGHGVAASPGIASGPIALDPPAAMGFARSGKPAILVRATPATEDIEGIASAAGLLTANGARTAHAAVVARQLGKACVIACADLAIDPRHAHCTIAGESFAQGEVITVDGDRGEVLRGAIRVVTEPARELLDTIESWRAA